MDRRSRDLVLLVGSVMLALSGCSTSASPTRSVPTGSSLPVSSAPTAISKAAEYRRIDLPLGAYALSDTDLALLHTAEDAFITGCMTQKGFHYTPLDSKRTKPAIDRRYGVIDSAVAATYGYHMPVAALPSGAPLAPDYVLALYGKQGAEGPDGCVGAAIGKFETPFADPTGADEASSINVESYHRSLDAPGVRKAFSLWSQCMRRSGFTYATPIEASSDRRFFASATATSQEIRTAVADVTCKDATGLVSAWTTAEIAIQQGLIAQQATTLGRLRADNEAELSAVRRYLG